MVYDIVVKNGHIIDPARGIDAIGDVAVRSNRIVAYEGPDAAAVQTVDASGCYVFPGLIDFHSHVFFDGTNTGANANFFPSTGVTSTVDAGSSGCCTFPMFYKNIIMNSAIRIKSFLSCYSMGLGGGKIVENFDPTLFDKTRISAIKNRFPEEILGLKIRLGHELKADVKNLAAAVEIAETIGDMAVCVHVTDSPDPLDEVVNFLRKGDILCHAFHGTGNTILNKDLKIPDKIWEARSRGVIFDQCNGKKNFSIEVCKTALSQGFYPDIISTDMGIDKLNYSSYVRSLPSVMGKLMSCGMPLADVVKRTTQVPAKLMQMEGQIGTLAPGAYADISVFKLEQRHVMHFDTFNVPFEGQHMLLPQMTIANGLIAFAQEDFNLLDYPN
jgi:dihydroorotase